MELNGFRLSARLGFRSGVWLLKNVLRAVDVGVVVRQVGDYIVVSDLSFPLNREGLPGFSGFVGLMRRGIKVQRGLVTE
ncbi:hypothetical protein [Vulcanisaeta thermophila]|uniref:hypothetical protein n=1 Tax=Vulcanisaeta thermophila TaxID=867917 RepID=UPI0008532382|nr:hypothetical protein [Vulcanisaeta thermophila]